MNVNPYLFFDNGQCAAAFKFYQKCLGGEITSMMTHGEAPIPEHTTPENRNSILHARLVIGDNALMGSDGPAGSPTQGFSVSLTFDDPVETERVFHALAEGGTVQMPIAETFWAVRFGMLTDQFGTPWMVNCEKAA